MMRKRVGVRLPLPEEDVGAPWPGIRVAPGEVPYFRPTVTDPTFAWGWMPGPPPPKRDGMKGMGLLPNPAKIAQEAIFGKSQSWYDNVNRLQNDYSIMNAELNAIGATIWDALVPRAAAAGVWLLKFSELQTLLNRNLNSILISESYAPSDATIQSVQVDAVSIRRMLDWATANAPGEIQARVAEWAFSMRSNLARITLKSPSAVGWETFWKTLKERAEALARDPFSPFKDILPWLIGGAAAVVLLPRLVKSNPLDVGKLAPLAIGAGLLFLLTGKKTEKKAGVAPAEARAVLTKEPMVEIEPVLSPEVIRRMREALAGAGIPFYLRPLTEFGLSPLYYRFGVPQSLAAEISTAQESLKKKLGVS
jgi:hypothetical protein